MERLVHRFMGQQQPPMADRSQARAVTTRPRTPALLAATTFKTYRPRYMPTPGLRPRRPSPMRWRLVHAVPATPKKAEASGALKQAMQMPVSFRPCQPTPNHADKVRSLFGFKFPNRDPRLIQTARVPDMGLSRSLPSPQGKGKALMSCLKPTVGVAPVTLPSEDQWPTLGPPD